MPEITCTKEKEDLTSRYDVTPFLHSHPGGSRLILNLAKQGVDASDAFRSHSPKGKKMWGAYKSGELQD